MKDALTLPWVVVAPAGVVYLGLHEDEAAAWSTALGWPSAEEIASRKAAGWYATQATTSWRRPDGEQAKTGAVQMLREALEMAKAGLEWYQDHCPDVVDGSDHEAMDQINRALTATEGV